MTPSPIKLGIPKYAKFLAQRYTLQESPTIKGLNRRRFDGRVLEFIDDEAEVSHIVQVCAASSS